MKLKSLRLSHYLIILGGLLLAGRFTFNIWRIWKVGDKVKVAEEQLLQAQNEQVDLKRRLAEVQTPEFVEREAREKLGYGREGEVIFVLPQSENNSKEAESATTSHNWRKWWNLYIGI